nr:BatD family protein [uncultured Brachyspira sp.]
MAGAELTEIGKLFFLIFLLIFLISFKSLFAQTTITAKLSDDKIGVGEIFTLSVTIDNGAGKITIPDIDGLMLRGTSKSVNMMYSSGSLKTIQTYSYNYVAIKEGFYTIDKITVKANNNTYIANPVSIEVVSDSVRNSILNKPEGDSFERFMNYREDIIVNNTINKKEFYIYEPIYIEQKAYSHVPVNVIGISKIPDRNDFLVYTDSSERNSYTEIIDGKRVNVIPLKKEVLFAVKQGEKNILTTPFVFEKNNMFYDRIQYGEEEFDIKILSLPSAKDYKNFSGAVGDFKFNTKINKTNINIGDEVLISIEVIGEGNISIINMPNLNDDIKNYFSVYQPKIFETNWFENNKMIGKKTKEYILVATNKGNYTIENIDFCYFSPNDKSYTNIYAKNINLFIDGNKNYNNSQATLNIGNDTKKTEIMQIRNNIIKKQNDKNFKLLNINIIYIYVLLMIAISIIIYNFENIKKLNFLNSNNKISNMDEILEYYNKKNRIEYCKAIKEFLIKNINKKFNIDSNADIYKELKNKNVDEETIKNIKDIIDSCQFELYSGNSINKNEDYHTKAINILKETDKLK